MYVAYTKCYVWFERFPRVLLSMRFKSEVETHLQLQGEFIVLLNDYSATDPKQWTVEDANLSFPEMTSRINNMVEVKNLCISWIL